MVLWRRKHKTDWSNKLWSGFGEIESAAAKAERERERLRMLGNERKPFGTSIVGRAATGPRLDPGDDIANLYDPDAIGRQFYKPAEEVARYAHVRVKAGHNFINPPTPHRLQLVECYREGMKLRYRLKEHYLKSGQELHQLSESAAFKASRFFETTGDWRPAGIDKRDYNSYVNRFREAAVDHFTERVKEIPNLRESDYFGQGFDGQSEPQLNTMAAMDQEFIPIAGGPYYRQLYLYAHWEQTAKAFEMKNHSELARAAIECTTNFTIGRGVSWKIKSPEAAAIWEEFWARNNMANRLRVLSDDKIWQGELLIRKYQPLRGFMAIRSIDPSAIYEIITDPQDVESVLFYHASYPTPWQQPYSDFRGHNLQVPFSQYVIQQYPANEIHHIKCNVSSSEKWGRSDFYVALGIMKRHRDWSNAATLKDLLQANLVWKIKVRGDTNDVEAFAQNQGNAILPAFGGTWIENEALELTQLHEDTAGSGRGQAGSTGGFLTSCFATSQSMPVSFFNVVGGGGAARANALVQGEPFTKKIENAQQEMRGLLDHLYEAAMKCAIEGGRVSSHIFRSADSDPEWIFPTLHEEDRSAKITAITAVRAEKAISHRTESTQLAQEIGLTEYDYDTEMEELQREQSNKLINPPTPTMMPEQPQLEPGMREKINGADARVEFKQQQRQSISDTDKGFIESAIASGHTSGRLRLPSGTIVEISAPSATTTDPSNE